MSPNVKRRASPWSTAPYPTEPGVSEQQKAADIEVLARMAARLAGRDPDQHVRMSWGGVEAFDDVMWRYPDFLMRAEKAYSVLEML